MSCSEYDAERLRRELARNEDVSELGIQVHITGDRVYLQGRVPTTERRRAVGEVAGATLPHCTVINEVTVTEMHEPHLEHLE